MSTAFEETMSTSSSGFFCDLCKLDFTTKEELREHTWTMLHHGKLNKAKGRGCVHECSLCNEKFDELLLYTKHLHGDTHQDLYNTWKKDQSIHQPTRSYSPIDTSLAFNQSSNFRRKLSTRNSNQNQKNSRARPERPTSRNRILNRNKRHNRDQELPLHLNTFPVENSVRMTESGNFTFENANSEINSSNDLPFYDRIKARKGNSKRNKGGDGNHTQSNQIRRDTSGKKKKSKKQSAKKRNSRGSSMSFDISLSSFGGTDLSYSIDQTKSLTPLMDVNLPSEYVSLRSGKDQDGITSTNQTTHKNPTNDQEISRNLRDRSRYVWISESLKKSFGIETNIPSSSNTSKPSDRCGVSHSIVGKGADEIRVDTTTETLGHDNGNPQDPKSEIISRVLNTKQSELQAEDKVPFVSKRRTRSSYAKNNTKDLDMTMDTDTRISTTNILSETNNNSTEKEKKSTRKKDPNQFITNSRLRSRSSSDDTALLSRQNSMRSSAIVTQYQPFDKTALVGTLEINPTKSGLNLKDTNATETSTQNSDKAEKEKPIRNNSGSLVKNFNPDHDQNTIKEQERIGKEDSNAQCSFVHIDGVRCSAKTSERLCSYHKRFPEGNLIKSEPKDDHPASTSLISLDLSTTTLQQDSMSFNQRYNDTEYPRDALSRDRTNSGDKKVQMMDLSMSTNFLSVPHSHLGMSSKHPSGIYPEWMNKRPRSREEASSTWTRTTSTIAFPVSSRAESKEPSYLKGTSSSTWYPSDHNSEPVRPKLEPVSPSSTPPSPHPLSREPAGPVPTLDLSRLNLPPNVRHALAMKYASKKPGESASTAANVAPNVSTSRNRFVEAKQELEQPRVPYQSLGPPPGALRAARIRQQRSISLDSYPSSAFERLGPMTSLEPSSYSRIGPPLSPLIAPESVFSIPTSKQTTTPEKAKMIDLNTSKYLPSRHQKISQVAAAAKHEKEPHLEKHSMTELGRSAMEKNALMSKSTIPALRTKIRTMSTERDSAYYKDSVMYHPTSKTSMTVPERRPSPDDQDGRYVVLETRPPIMYHQETASIRSPRPYTYGDSKNVFDFNAPGVQSQGQRVAADREKRKDATAIALESHFRQSLKPAERSVGTTAKLSDHGMIDLGLSTIDTYRKTASPREAYPVSTHKGTVSQSRPPVTTHLIFPTTDSIKDNTADQSAKRKAEDEPEPEHKRQKGAEASSLSQPLSYLPGFEVQELLRLEHQEQSQLKSLHEVQDQVKATRIKLQALNIELESLQVKEKRISEEISHTKNKRVEILQGALQRDQSSLNKVSSCESQCTPSSSPPSSSGSVYANTSNSGNDTHASLKSTDSTHVVPAIGNEKSITQTNNLSENHTIKNVDNGNYSSSQSEQSKTLTDSTNLSSAREETSVKIKIEVDEEFAAQPCCSTSAANDNPSDLPETEGNHTTDETHGMNSRPPSKDQPSQDKQTKHDDTFEKSKKQFLNKIKKELNTPKKRQHLKMHRKKFSESRISNSIALSKDKILLVREKMRGWKVQQERNDSNDIDEGPIATEPSQEIPTTYKGTALTPSKIPEHDVSNVSKPQQSSNQRQSSSSSSKSDTNIKTKGKAVIKKRLSHNTAKSQLRKKRKSSYPSKRENVQTSVSSSPQARNEMDGDEDPQQTNNNETEETTSNSQFHLAAVESLRQKLKKTSSGSKALSTSKARASSFEGHTGAVCALKVYQGRLYTSSADKTTKAFDIQTGECVKEYLGHNHAVNCLEISQDGDRLFTGSNDQTVRSYNIKTGSCTHKFTFDGRVMCLHSGFGLLYVGLSTGTVTIVDLMKNTCVEKLQCHEPRGVSCLATGSEGQRSLLCTGSFDATVSIRDHKNGLLIKTLKSHTMTVLCIQVVENIIYSGAADCQVLAHNLNTGDLLRSYDGHTLSVSGLQVVGRVLVSSCLDKLIRCYDLMSAELLQAYGGQSDMIFSVHLSNGRIYSGARDGRVSSVKLDLRVYHPCKWKDCQLNFGISSHMKEHLKEVHVIQPGSIDKCLWADCGHVFNDSEGIETIMNHVLGHVDAKNVP